MEQGRKFHVLPPKAADPLYRLIRRMRGRYTHFYFYIRDDVLGPFVMCVGSFLPFQTTYYLNGHHFMAGELERQGIRFRRDDNAFLSTADAAALQAAADRLTADVIRKRLDYWTRVLGPKFSREDRAAVHLRREYSLNQVEYAGISSFGAICRSRDRADRRAEPRACRSSHRCRPCCEGARAGGVDPRVGAVWPRRRPVGVGGFSRSWSERLSSTSPTHGQADRVAELGQQVTSGQPTSPRVATRRSRRRRRRCSGTTRRNRNGAADSFAQSVHPRCPVTYAISCKLRLGRLLEPVLLQFPTHWSRARSCPSPRPGAPSTTRRAIRRIRQPRGRESSTRFSREHPHVRADLLGCTHQPLRPVAPRAVANLNQ